MLKATTVTRMRRVGVVEKRRGQDPSLSLRLSLRPSLTLSRKMQLGLLNSGLHLHFVGIQDMCHAPEASEGYNLRETSGNMVER